MDEQLKRKAQKLLDNKGNEFLTQLEATLDVVDSLKEVTEAIKSIPETIIPEYPEIVIPEQKEVVFPDIQKVELINPPKEKDDKEVQKLLKELVAEVKKKEQYAYDIEIDSALKEQLRGEKGDKGEDGKNGNEIEAVEIANKLETLEGGERLDVSAVKGTEELIEDIATKIAKEEVKKVKKQYISVGRGSTSSGGVVDSFETVSANLDASDATLNYDVDGNITSIDYSNGITKTFNYTGEDITSIVLSGSTPSGISLTKTLTYTSGDVTDIAYS